METVYLFIDGGYLREVYGDLFRPVFGDYPIDYQLIKTEFGARRAFLYDCLDDVQRQGEIQADFETRVKRQQEEFDGIDKGEGIHVRYGYLSPGKRKQQKEVDVSLAVDMLTHSFARNMSKAVLLAGDRDFRPVVESLVRLGTYVQLVYEPKTGAKELALAADSEMEIDIAALCRWAKIDQYENRSEHFPLICGFQHQDRDPVLQRNPNLTRLRSGIIGPAKYAFSLYNTSTETSPPHFLFTATVKVSPLEYRAYYFSDQVKLLAYLTQLYGETELNEA